MRDFHLKFDRSHEIDTSPDEACEIMSHHSSWGEIAKIELLAGGFIHGNWKVTFSSGRTAVLRMAQGHDRMSCELAVLARLPSSVPAPQVYHRGEWSRGTYALLEFIPGERLDLVIDSLRPGEVETIVVELGRHLSVFHEISFGSSGFLNSRGEVAEPAEVGTMFTDYILASLSEEIVQTRLGPDLTRQCRTWVEDHRSLVIDIAPQRRLTHCDFNTKNILVREETSGWTIAAILDWEWAFSGSPLADLANFLRFEEEVNLPLAQWLTEGYGLDSPVFIDGWRQAAALLDLASMCNFLTRPTDYPRTIATARGVIEKTLHRWSD